MSGTGSIVRSAAPNPPPTLDMIAVAPIAEAKLPAVVSKPASRRISRVLRVAMPYCIAAGIAGSILGGVGAVGFNAGWFAALSGTPTAIAVEGARDAHINAIRADYKALSFKQVLTLRNQAEAAWKAGIGFAREPAPLAASRRDDERFRVIQPEEVARALAEYGRVYVGTLGERSRDWDKVVESPSAKAITSIAELQSVLSKF
jgi:hypothetical protein